MRNPHSKILGYLKQDMVEPEVLGKARECLALLRREFGNQYLFFTGPLNGNMRICVCDNNDGKLKTRRWTITVTSRGPSVTESDDAPPVVTNLMNQLLGSLRERLSQAK